MPNLLTLTRFRGVLHNVVGKENAKDVTWEQFALVMQKFEVLKDKKAGQAWSPVTFTSLTGYTFDSDFEETDKATGEVRKRKRWKNSTGRTAVTDEADNILRRDENVRQVFMAVLDFDHMTEPLETILAPWAGYNYIVHTTYSHNPKEEDNRYRLIVPFTEPVTADEFKQIWPVLRKISGDRCDKQCKNLSRLFFLPAHHPDRKEFAFSEAHIDGKPLKISAKQISDLEKAEKKAVAPTGKVAARNTTPYGQRGDYRTLDAVAWFSAHQMFIGPAGRQGKYHVKCPWASEHTNGIANAEDTVLYEDPGRWPTFACSHSHCEGRDIKQVNELWGDIDSYCREKLPYDKVKAQLKTEVKTVIRCLGYDGEQQKRYWYQSSETSSITKLKAEQHKKLNLFSITGDLDYWFANFGDEEGKINWEAAALFFINQGNKAGLIRPEVSMRGLGVVEDAGRTVAHLGHTLWVDGRITPITSIKSAFIYERSYPEIQLTAPASLSEAQKVFSIVDRLSIPKESERVLLAGALVAGYLGGILEYRPHCWLVGMPDSGKSATMREVIAKLWTPVGGLFREGKTTDAGVRQTLEKNAVPVAIDEAEARDKDEISRIAKLVTLARNATSAGSEGGTGQGTSGGRSMTFRARSSFIFASITPGLLSPEDKQRFSIVNFRANPESVRGWHKFSQEIRTTLTPEFAFRFFHRAVLMNKTILKNIDIFRNVILEKVPTASSRFSSHIGTLLACAYTYFADDQVTPEKAWIFYDRLGDWEDYRLEKFEENNAHHVYSILMTHMIQDGIHRKTVAELIEEAMRPEVLAGDSGKILRRFGIRVDGMHKRVFISNSHPTLNDIMTNRGIINHNTILREYPGAVVDKNPVRLDTSSSTYRGVWLPYEGETNVKMAAPVSSLSTDAPVSAAAAGEPTLF